MPLGRGGWHYEVGYRICVSGMGGSVSKTQMQSAFGEFGHIIRIETPASKGLAYITFQDKKDAQDAVKHMDGETADGHRMKVAMADNKPPPKETPKEKGQRESQADSPTPAPAAAASGPISRRRQTRRRAAWTSLSVL